MYYRNLDINFRIFFAFNPIKLVLNRSIKNVRPKVYVMCIEYVGNVQGLDFIVKYLLFLRPKQILKETL